MNYKNKTTYLFKIEITFQGAACAPLALLKKGSEGINVIIKNLNKREVI